MIIVICLGNKSSKGYSELSSTRFDAYRNADNMRVNGYDAHVEEVTIKDAQGKPKTVYRVWCEDYP